MEAIDKQQNSNIAENVEENGGGSFGIMSLTGEVLGEIKSTKDMTIGDFVNALRKLDEAHKAKKFDDEYMTRVYDLSFLSDITDDKGEKLAYDVDDEVTPAARKMVGTVLHHFFNLDEFIDCLGPVTWQQAGLRHISIGKEKDSSRLVVVMAYFNSELTAIISKSDTDDDFQYSLCVPSKVLKNYFANLSTKYLGFPLCEGYYGRGFADHIVIKITNPKLTDLTKLIENGVGDDEFSTKFEEAVADGFVPDQKFIQLLLFKERSFELVCRAATVADYSFTYSDLKRGVPRMINENVIGRFIPDPKLDGDEYNRVCREHMEKYIQTLDQIRELKYALRSDFMDEAKPFWYSETEAEKQKEIAEENSKQRQLAKEQEKIERDEHVKLCKENRVREKKKCRVLNDPSEEELICLRLAPTYNDRSYRYNINGVWYNRDGSDLPESHTKMVNLLRTGDLLPDLKTLSYCIRMRHKNPNSYSRKNPQGKSILRKSHLVATLQAIIDLGKIELNEDDLKYILEFHHPEYSELANWLFTIVKPNRVQVYRYLDTKSQREGLLVHDISDCYLKHCNEPFTASEIEDIFIKYRISGHDIELSDINHTVSRRYFEFLLDNVDLDFHLYREYNQLHYNEDRDGNGNRFNPFANIVVVQEDIIRYMTNIKKVENVKGEKNNSLSFHIVQSLLRSNPNIVITMKEVGQIICLGYDFSYVFLFLSKVKEVYTKDLHDIVLHNAIYKKDDSYSSGNDSSRNNVRGSVKLAKDL